MEEVSRAYLVRIPRFSTQYFCSWFFSKLVTTHKESALRLKYQQHSRDKQYRHHHHLWPRHSLDTMCCSATSQL